MIILYDYLYDYKITHRFGHLFKTYHDELGDVSVSMQAFKKRSREVASSM